MKRINKDEEKVLNNLKKTSKIALLYSKNKKFSTSNVVRLIIDKEKHEIDERNYLNDLVEENEFEALEKANSFIYAKTTAHPYQNLSKEEVLEIFECFWDVIFGKKDKEIYLKLVRHKKIISIEITRNDMIQNKVEQFKL